MAAVHCSVSSKAAAKPMRYYPQRKNIPEKSASNESEPASSGGGMLSSVGPVAPTAGGSGTSACCCSVLACSRSVCNCVGLVSGCASAFERSTVRRGGPLLIPAIFRTAPAVIVVFPAFSEAFSMIGCPPSCSICHFETL